MCVVVTRRKLKELSAAEYTTMEEIVSFPIPDNGLEDKNYVEPPTGSLLTNFTE